MLYRYRTLDEAQNGSEALRKPAVPLHASTQPKNAYKSTDTLTGCLTGKHTDKVLVDSIQSEEVG